MICRIYTLAWAIFFLALIEKALINQPKVLALAMYTGIWPRNLLLLCLVLFISVIAHNACCGAKGSKVS